MAVRFSVVPEAGTRNVRWPRLSPDGRLLVYQADDSAGVTRTWIRPLHAFTATPLAGSENANRPFCSPDSRSLAFTIGDQMKRIDVRGGPAQLVGEAKGGFDGCWSTGGVILFDGGLADSIRQIAADGGKATAATRIDRARGELYHAWPTLLPDGKRFLFLAGHSGSELSILKLGQLGSLESKEIGPIPSRVEFAPSGHLLYVQENTLTARPFDAAEARFVGGPLPVGEGALTNADLAHFSVSNSGVIAYGVAAAADRSVLAWVERNGQTLEQLGTAAVHQNPVLSPDGTQIAYELVDPRSGSSDLWVRDLRRGIATRVTFDSAVEAWSLWSPDGKRLVYGTIGAASYTMLARRLVAQRFDRSTLRPVGELVRLGDAPPAGAFDGAPLLSASASGVLAHTESSPSHTELVWFDRTGQPTGKLTLPPARYESPSLSPDGDDGHAHVLAGKHARGQAEMSGNERAEASNP